MIIENFKPFSGESCEIVTVGNLLKHRGIMLSEPMLFGVGEGLVFIYWDSKQMGYPFLGGRCKQDVFTENLVCNLGLNLDVLETTSQKKAWEFIKTKIDNGIPSGIKLDCYYLEYFTQKIHFAAHYVTMYGYDETNGYLIDTVQQGLKVKSSLSSIAEARNAKGPMSSRNRAFSITDGNEVHDLENVIVSAIFNNAEVYLNPPIRNVSFKGIKTAAQAIVKWFERPEITPQLITQAGMLMDSGGTGGALFRSMYRDFLKECDDRYPELGLRTALDSFSEVVPMWTEVSRLICSAGENNRVNELQEASNILMDIADMEESAMRNLYQIAANNRS